MDVVNYLLNEAPQHLRIQGDATLIYAAYKGLLAVVKHRVENAHVLVNNDNVLALMNAAKNGLFPVVEYLFQKIPEVMRIKEKETIREQALIIAAKNGREEVVRYLVNNSPVPEISHYEEALLHAVRCGCLNVDDPLLKSGGLHENYCVRAA